MLIQPISELKNYNTILDSVQNGNPIYLTKNGKGVYAIFTIDDANEYMDIKNLKEDVQNISLQVSDFFIADATSFENKIAKSVGEAKKDKKRYSHNEVWSTLRQSINGK